MNIDLLLTQQGDAGLVADFIFDSPVVGVMYDAQTQQLNIEHSDMDVLEMNIPVQDDFSEALLWKPVIQIGVLSDGHIQDSRQVPLMFLNDPDNLGMRMPNRATNSVTAFEQFLKNCVAGQPIHRDDLGDEEGSSSSVMGGINRAVLEYAPHLVRQKALELGQNLQMNGPSGPAGPTVPGLGPAGAPPRSQPPPQRQNPYEDED